MNSKPLIKADLSLISTPNDMPSDVYKYMIKNALSLQRSKLMEAGKFFYPKEFVKIDFAEIRQNKIKCYKREKNGTRKDVTAELSQSLWIADQLHFCDSTDAVIRFLPKTAVWNLQKLHIIRQVISYEIFKYLTLSVGIKIFHMSDAQIQYSDINNEVPLEKIFELLPKCINLSFYYNAPTIESLEAANTYRPSNLRSFYITELDEKFDFKTFSTFMINNQNILYWITFKSGISKTYANKVKSMIIKIKKAWNNKDGLPHFNFPKNKNWFSHCFFV